MRLSASKEATSSAEAPRKATQCPEYPIGFAFHLPRAIPFRCPDIPTAWPGPCSGAASPSDLRAFIRGTQGFQDVGKRPDRDFRDLGHFVARLLARSPGNGVQEAAEKVRDQLARVVSAHQNEGTEVEDSTGLSVYLPTAGIAAGMRGKVGRHDLREAYRKTDLARDTRWDEWLESARTRLG